MRRSVAALAVAAITGVAASSAAAGPIPAEFTPAQFNDAFWGPAGATPSATSGMGVNDARSANIPGIRGEQVRVYIADGPLNDPSHVEFAGQPVKTYTGLTPPSASSHSIMATSTVAGKNVGIVPNVQQAAVLGVDGNMVKNILDGQPANGIAGAEAGDVLLVERASGVIRTVNGANYWYAGPFEGNTLAVAKTFRAATDLGIFVVEPTGNGNNGADGPREPGPDQGTPLDDPQIKPVYQIETNAIWVSAGQPVAQSWCSGNGPARSRIDYAPYGSRVDVHGPGSCYAAAGADGLNGTGVGGYRGANATHNAYQAFGGASGGSAVVTGIVAAISSAYEARTGTSPTPDAVRNVLRRTSTAQVGTTAAPVATQPIGGLPNLPAAIAALAAAPETTATSSASVSVAQPTFTVASPTTGVSFECRIVPDPLPSFEALLAQPLAAWAPCNGAGTTTHRPSTPLANGDYMLQARAVKADATGGGKNFDASPAQRAFSVAANSGTVALSGGVINYVGTSRASAVTLRRVGGAYRISDPAGIVAAPSCFQSTAFLVLCTASGVTSATITTGAGNDTIDADVAIPVTLQGGNGNDTLISTGAGNDVFTGGGGTDAVDYQRITSGGITASANGVANDGPSTTNPDNIAADVEKVIGTTGADTFTDVLGSQTYVGLAGNDTYRMYTGAGTNVDAIQDSGPVADSDTVDFRNLPTGISVTRDGSDLRATATSTGYDISLQGLDSVVGTAFDDGITLDDHGMTASGGSGDDYIVGGAGADSITGGAGFDEINARGGDDLISVKDAASDLVFGGTGNDTAGVDAGLDQVSEVESTI